MNKPPSSAGAGFRLLNIGEKILATDDVFDCHNNKWIKFSYNGNYVVRGARKGTLPYGWYRRKVSVEIPDGWRILPRGWRIRNDDKVLEINEWVRANEGAAEGIWSDGETVIRRLHVRKNKLNPGVGYRLLKIGEKVIKGDEISHDGHSEWYPCKETIGEKAMDGWNFRRKIEPKPVVIDNLIDPQPTSPGEGYCFLNPGEPIRKNIDEVCHNGIWEVILSNGVVSNSKRGEEPWPFGWYRTKVVDPFFIDISFVATEHTIKEGNVYREVARHANDPVRLFIGHGRYPYWIGNGTIYPCSIPTILIRKMVSEGKLVLTITDAEIRL